jgi:hypothetical protein
MIKLKSLFRRGQASPSSTASAGSSKQQQTHQNSPSHSVGIKSSASASSLDRIAAVNAGSASADLGATRKLSKNHKQSSKDKLNDLLRVGSKEKIFDDKKELKKQLKHQQKQMQVAQQSSSMHHPSTSTGEQKRSEHHPKDFDPAAFNGMQDVSSFNFPLFVSKPTRVFSRSRQFMRVRVSLSIEFSCRLKFVVFIPSAG